MYPWPSLVIACVHACVSDACGVSCLVGIVVCVRGAAEELARRADAQAAVAKWDAERTRCRAALAALTTTNPLARKKLEAGLAAAETAWAAAVAALDGDG